MSLAVLAQNVASKGRNGDTMLVHMTPEEVKGLHALALVNGTPLTTNPETGLPEASRLTDLLKTVLPAVAGFALGPAGFGLMSSLQAGLTVGAVTGLATGSLQKGIIAGFGAYGGSTLGEGFIGAGEGAVGAGALASEAGQEAIRAKMAAGLSEEAARAAVAKEAVAGAGFFDKLAAGGKEVFAPGGIKALQAGMPPGSFSPTTLAAMAAAPIIADQMVPTATPMPTAKPGDTGYVRSFQFDPRTQGLQYLGAVPANQIRPAPVNRAPAPVPAPAPYPSEQPPGGYNGGGIVALAGGGTPRPDVKPDMGEFMKKAGVDFFTASDIMYGVIGGNQDRRNWAAIMDSSDPLKAARQATNAMYGGVAQGPGIWSPEIGRYVPMLYAADGTKLTSQIERSENFGVGLSGGEKYVLSAQQLADLNRPPPEVEPPVTVPVTSVATAPAPSGTITGGEVTSGDLVPATTQPGGVPPTFTAPPAVVPKTTGTDVTYGGGTLQQQQNAPLGTAGQGYRGTETMAQVRDEYTRGGGRLGVSGYVTPEPVLTGGSKQAYDYLMGRGAYPVAPYTPTGTPIMRPYTDIVAGSGRPPGPTITLPKRPDRATALNVPSGDSGVKASTLSTTGSTGLDTLSTTGGVGLDTGLQTWRNENTGEIFYSPKGGYAPQGEGWKVVQKARGGLADVAAMAAARGGDVQQYNLGGYSDGGRLLRGPGDGVSDSIPATIGNRQPARLADGEFVIPARIVSEIGNGSTEAGARKLYAMMDRVQRARAKTTGKGKVAKNTRADKYLPA